MNKIKLIILILCVFLMGFDVHAQTPKVRYTTKKVALRNKASGKIIRRLRRGKKVIQIRAGNKWSIIERGGKRYVVRKKFLTKYKPLKAKYSGAYLRKAGAVLWGGNKYTWYSQRVLPDPTNWLGIKGKHVDKQGFICDEKNFICLGSNVANRGKIVKTPFGKWGKVYDAGYVTCNWYDCYTDW